MPPDPDPRPATSPLARVVLAAVRGYKGFLSPLFAGSCRFTPSCADYTAEAVRLHGAGAGLLLGLRRLGRCRPFGAWGFDPVPLPLGSGPSPTGPRTWDDDRSSCCAAREPRAKVR